MKKGGTSNLLKPAKTITGDKGMVCNIYRYSPVSMWEEDLSEIKARFDELKIMGIHDFGDYIKKHPDEVISLAGKVKIISVNEATLKLYHAGSKEELCRSLDLIFDKQSYLRFTEELIALCEGKTEFETEAVTRTLKGEERHVILKSVVAPGHVDTLSKVFVNVVDVTSIKKKLIELCQAEEKYRRLFEVNDDAILIVDKRSGIILEANRRSEQLLGLSREDIVGKHFSEICPEEEVDYYRRIVQNTEQNPGVSQDIVISHNSGKTIPVKVSCRAVELSAGRKISGWFFREITKDEAQYKSEGIEEPLHHLTPREKQIFQYILDGYKNRQIASRLFISEKTVETHRANIMAKLNVHHESDLIRYAVSLGLIQTKSSDHPKPPLL